MKIKKVILQEMPEIKPEQIEQVYIGKPNVCMCGCAGNYFDKPAKKLRVLNKVRKFANAGVEVLDGYIFTLIRNTTQYTIYLDQKYALK